MLVDKNIENITNKLIKGDDYREEIINAISADFMDWAINFFKQIAQAKIDDKSIDLAWYKKSFLQNKSFTSDETAIFSGTNKKTITNIYGSSTKEIVIDAANRNFDYVADLISSLEQEGDANIAVAIKISYNKVNVELNLAESLIVINALATKKIAIRGSAWSSIGKQVEKPLLIKLCKMCHIADKHMDSSLFKKDKSKDVDRETDFKLLKGDKIYRVEVKLMGRGNPESADAVIARDSDILIADTLSVQNKNQLNQLGIYFVELRDNKNVLQDFAKILQQIGIPYKL